MKKMLAAPVFLFVAGAFVAGYWSQREGLNRAQANASDLRRQLRTALDAVRRHA